MYGIYANIGGYIDGNVTIYSSTMDPMGDEWIVPLDLDMVTLVAFAGHCRYFRNYQI
jgi:hypothetical protein